MSFAFFFSHIRKGKLSAIHTLAAILIHWPKRRKGEKHVMKWYLDSNVSSGRARLAGVIGRRPHSPGECGPCIFCPSDLMGAEVVRTQSDHQKKKKKTSGKPSGERTSEVQRWRECGWSEAGVQRECNASAARGWADIRHT